MVHFLISHILALIDGFWLYGENNTQSRQTEIVMYSCQGEHYHERMLHESVYYKNNKTDKTSSVERDKKDLAKETYYSITSNCIHSLNLSCGCCGGDSCSCWHCTSCSRNLEGIRWCYGLVKQICIYKYQKL